jgi:hypothetical protein
MLLNAQTTDKKVLKVGAKSLGHRVSFCIAGIQSVCERRAPTSRICLLEAREKIPNLTEVENSSLQRKESRYVAVVDEMNLIALYFFRNMFFFFKL